MKIRCLRKLFNRRPKIIKTINSRIGLSDEVLKQQEEDQKKMFPNPIRHGNRRPGKRNYGRIISYPITRKHREGTSWLYDDKEK